MPTLGLDDNPLLGPYTYEQAWSPGEVATGKRTRMNRELPAFFSELFRLNLKDRHLTNTSFPTFEEVLGLTDLS